MQKDGKMTETEIITSPQNEGLKLVRKLRERKQRERLGLFVVEGEDLIATATESGQQSVRLLSAASSGLAGDPVDPELLGKVSELGSGTRTIGIYEQAWSVPSGPLCIYLHGVSDPGNIGTVLRSALAFGASCVVLGPNCADPYGPKAVRASMGAIFRVPLARAESVGELPGRRVALVAHKGEPLTGPTEGELTLVVGAERSGLPEEVISACDATAHIPITNDSLNVAMAVTVALYELREPEDA